MLDHDELLPEEQDSVELVTKLQSFYQLKPEERQTLAHVQQQLAQVSDLPPLQSIRGGSDKPSQRALNMSIPSRPGASRTKKLQLSTLVAVLLIGLIVGSMGITFALIQNAKSGSTATGTNQRIQLTLVPKDGSAPSQQVIETAVNILSERFAQFGLQGSHVESQKNGTTYKIFVEVPHFKGDEQGAIATQIAPGILEFWSTKTDTLPYGANFDSTKYINENPGGKPLFTNDDLDPTSLGVGKSPQDTFVIDGAMKGAAKERLSTFTANHIGTTMTITLDNKVLVSAIIQNQLTESFQLAGPYTEEQAKAIVSVLKTGTLPVDLKKVG